MMRQFVAPLLVLVAAAAPARADVVLRMAGVAPDGSSWTREFKAFSREVETATGGHVRLKWIWGGIAGDEVQVFDRIRRDQLDGQAAASACDRVAPSIRITRVLGLVQSWDEASFVMRRLSPQIDEELHKSGFVGFAGGVGSDILFTREPVRSLADLRKARLWMWNIDQVMRPQLEAIGVRPVPLPLEEALPAYEDGRTDGFFAIPTAALAYQWSARARYFVELRMGFVAGCMLIANRAFDALSVSEQQSVREAAARLMVRFEQLGRSDDEKLLGGLFARQGLRPLPPSAAFRSEFFSAAEEARQHVPAEQLPPGLLQKVSSWLADYRAQHR